MTFGLARTRKIVIQYVIDTLPDVKYKMTFLSHDGLNKWINEHTECTILQMLLRYEYPNVSEVGCVEQRQNHADKLHRICMRGALSSRKVQGESFADNRLF